MQGKGMQPNAAALAMLAAAGRNPGSFGINPAVLVSLNPALAAALGAGGQQAVPPSAAPQTAPAQNYGMGNMGIRMQGSRVLRDFKALRQCLNRVLVEVGVLIRADTSDRARSQGHQLGTWDDHQLPACHESRREASTGLRELLLHQARRWLSSASSSSASAEGENEVEVEIENGNDA